jgi:hypothetical protein
MLVGIIDLLYDRIPSRRWDLYGYYFRKQFMGIAPQAVAVWCRQLGHRVHYRAYWGQADPLRLLPDDLSVLFVSSYTQSSALAYAIAAFFKRKGTLTVIGGPHARSFPTDCARFFDVVVKDCDRELVDDILRRRFDAGTAVSASRPPSEFPSVEERMPEITVSSFYQGKPGPASFVPILSSVGCPYSCNFCVDWNSTYVTVSADRLHADLDFVSRHYPKIMVAYHDPNFAVRFDSTMDVILRVPSHRRNPYVMESSLSILKQERLPRLAETNCAYVVPGVESWTDYSNKSGTVSHTGSGKLEKVVGQLDMISKYVPGIQVNFMFGTDGDQGDEPIALTKEFIRRLPEVWPSINIPTPYGGTPLYDQLYREGRIIRGMPFAFYYNPYLAIMINHYDPPSFYDRLIELNLARASATALLRRLASRAPRAIRFVNTVRTFDTWLELRELRRIRAMLRTDAQFRAFHEGRSQALPPFYEHLFERRLGRYAELLPRAARYPILDLPPPLPGPASVARDAPRRTERQKATVKSASVGE